MRKILALGLTGMLLCGSLSACAPSNKMDISDVVIPTFEETEGIEFIAYAGMTVENWNGLQRNVNTLTDEHFQKFVDAGFNTMLALYEGAPSGRGADAYETIELHSSYAAPAALQALELAEKYDVKYYVRDWPFYSLCDYWTEGINTEEAYRTVLTKMFDENNQYIHSSAYAGNFGRDEPGVDQYEMLEWQIRIYNEIMEEYGIEGEFFLNLLPNYGSDASFGGHLFGEPCSYNEYIDLYFEKLAPLLGYASYDYYPFKRDAKTGSMMRTTMAANLQTVALKCKESGYELRTFVQTGGDWTGLRDLTSVGDFRFQVYTNLAFGSKKMSYYQYGGFSGESDGDFSLLNMQDGTYNYTYDLAKTVNNEVHKFEDAYLHYDYDGIMCYSALPAGQINVNFRSVTNKMTSHPRIAEVKVEQDAIMGAFKDADGNDAFMLVNYTDPYYDLDNQVTVKFNDAKALLMYRFGEEHVVALNKDGTYTFDLYPGEGRFIIPLK